MTMMLRKDGEIKWEDSSKDSFSIIKKDLGQTPMLMIPYYGKDFMIFPFDFEHTIVVILLQKNDEVHEKPIAFFNKSLRDVELK
jgi:hypothetical protein